MKIFQIGLCSALLFLGTHTQAQQVPLKALGRVVLDKGITAALGKTINADILRSVYATSRQMVQLPDLDIVRSLVQVKLPNHTEVLGTGFLLEYQNRFFVAMPYHIGGKNGAQRALTFFDNQSFVGKVSFSGNAGFHSPDLSLIEMPKTMLSGKIPLRVGKIDASKPAYTFGYTGGPFKSSDYFVTKRTILGTEGMGVMGNRVVIGETPGQVLNLSGACGSPLVQRGKDGYYAVGIHTGSIIKSTTNLSENLTFAANLSKALNSLLENAGKMPEETLRPLQFNGIQVDNLTYVERVKTIEVVRDGKVISSQEIRNFPQLYSDLHSELAFAGEHLLPGDLLRYHIQGEKHALRVVEYRVP